VRVRSRHTLVGVALAVAVLASWGLRLPRGPGADALDFDVNLYFYPVYEATYRRIAAGTIPTWNPWQLCGIPWLATLQGGVFYPFHVLYLLLPLHLGLAASHLIHLPLAALATAAFARRAGLSGPAAILAALLFTIRGMFALSLAAPNYVEAVAWLPVGALGVLDLARGRLAPGAALLALAATMSLLAGYPQPTAYMLCLWASLAVALLLGARTSPRRAVAASAAFAGALVLAALAAGIELFPALELVHDGAHRELGAEAMAPFGISPAAVLLGTTAIAGGAFSWGVVALALVAAALVAPHARVLGVWALLATALAVVVSLGDRTPLFAVYRALPFLGSFRFPDRALGMADFTLAIAAAVGLDAVVAGGAERRRLAPLAALVGIVAIAALARIWGAPAEQLATVGVAALVAGALVLVCVAGSAGTARVAGAALVVVAATETIVAPWRHLVTYTPRTAARYETHGAAYRALAARLGSDRAWIPNGIAGLQPEHARKLPTRYGVRTIDDYEPLAPRRQAQYFTFFGEGSIDFHRPPWLFAGEIPSLTPPAGIAPPATRRRLLDLAAVRLVMLPKGARAARPDLDAGLDAFLRDGGFEDRPFDDPAFTLLENPHALPRAFVTYRTRPAPAPDALLAALARPDFDPLAESYVERMPPIDEADAPRGAPARIVVDDERTVQIEASLSRPGLVVLADAYYPGWRVTVDGVRATIFPTNHLFRGVPVSAGPHRVRFEYRPTSVGAGAIASALGWLGIALVAIRARRTRR
jgi:hypothetical protein